MPLIGFGEPAPWFTAATPTNPAYHLNSVAGRCIILVFLGRPSSGETAQIVREVRAHRDAFDDKLASLFFVVGDALDIDRYAIRQETPGIRYFMDYDNRIATAYGFADPGAPSVRCGVTVLDRTLRGLQSVVVREGHPIIGRILEGLHRLEDFFTTFKSLNHAPVLVLERIFEPSFCRALIDYYNANQPKDSGFMREQDGFTVGRIDHGFKRRQDVTITDERLVQAAMGRIFRRLVPQIRKAFQFEVTRMDRNLVACYDAERGGFFRPHRDNTTKGTAHRRFAVTLNLNSEEFEGGELRLPEFGDRSYRAPTGGAIVFSCALLHEALPVTAGKRYAFLPFLYNEADAELRLANRKFLDVKSGGEADVDRLRAGAAGDDA